MTVIIDHVSKSFGHTQVLKDVCLHAETGRVHALLGRNGAGKSTLFSILVGLLPADSGTVSAPGNIGASLNGPAFYGHLSARNNLKVHTKLLDLPDSEADRVLSVVGLSQTGKKKAKAFSTGMKARLALAQAILGDPEILVLDEPQNGLDPQGISDLRVLLRDFAARGKTVIVSSHQLGEVRHLADDATIIAGGTTVFSGPLTELAVNGDVESEFFRLTTQGEH